MNMKKLTYALSLFAIGGMLFTSCKRTANVEPEQDTETSTAVDASWALFAVTDMEMMCAYLGENQLGLANIYRQNTTIPIDPAIGGGTVTATRNLENEELNIAFDKSACMDGRVRSGTVFMGYKYSEEDWLKAYYKLAGIDRDYKPRFYHEYGFLGRMSLSDYKVDKWTIVRDSTAPRYGAFTAVTWCDMGQTNYNPKVTPVKWSYKGDFVIYSPERVPKSPGSADSMNKFMKIKVDLTKTLVNSSTKAVFDATDIKKDAPITWSLAVVAYHGTAEGVNINGQPFKINIDQTSPLIRDFTCFPDRVGNVTVSPSGTIAPVAHEFHPFNAGIMTFVTSVDGKEQYPRKVYFGNEGNADLEAQCDNTGEVMIKGISYKVTFRK